MSFVLCILVWFMTQVAANTHYEKGDTSVTTCQRSQTMPPRYDRCIKPDICKNWLYTNPASGAKVFEFCDAVTKQMECLFDKEDNNDKLEKRMNDMEIKLQTCTRKIKLKNTNNETTIANLQLLNVSVTNISHNLVTMQSKQEQHENKLRSTVNRLDSMDDQLKEFTSDINSSNTVTSNITSQLKNLELKTTTIQVELKSKIDASVYNLESTLRTEIQSGNTQMKEQIVTSVNKSESQMKNQLADLKEETDKNISKIKTEVFETDSQRNTVMLELSDNITRLRESLTADVEATKRLLGEKIQNLNNDFEGEKSHLKTIETELKTEFNDGIAEGIGKLKIELNGALMELENKLEAVKINISQEKQEVKQTTDLIERNIETIKTELLMQIDNIKQELQSSIDNQISALDGKMDDMSERLNKEIEAIYNTHAQFKNDIEAKLNDQENHFQKADKSLQDSIKENVLKLETETKKIESEIHAKIKLLKEDVSTQIVNEVEKLTKQTKEVNQTVIKQKEMVDIIYPNTFNKEMFQMAFLFLVVLVLINFAIVYCLVKNSHPSTQMSRSAAARNNIMGTSNVPNSPNEVMRRFHFSSMPSHVSLELRNAITVVSFYEDAQKHHRRLVESIVLPEALSSQQDIDYHVVRRHEDITSMPPSKLYLMFVEFSERHVIIEEPGLGLGDLKRKTAEAITNIGACLVIVYVRDPGSRRLPKKKLFNDGIYCVTSQPELKVLHKNDRFLSIYDTFTEFQKERIAQIIEANIDVSDVHNTPKRMSKSLHSLQ